MSRLIVLLLLAFLLAPAASAQDDAAFTADRPGFATGAGLVGEMNLQIEAGYAYTETDGRVLHDVGQLLLRFGLSERLEVRAHVNSYLFDPDSFDVAGLNDAAVSLKVGLLGRETTGAGPMLTAIAGLMVPTGGDVFTEGEWQPHGRLAASLPLGAGLGLSANVGYGTGSGLLVTPSVSFAVPGSNVGLFVGYAAFELLEEPVEWIEGGVTFMSNEDLQLDVNAGMRVGGGDAYFAGLGLVRRL